MSDSEEKDSKLPPAKKVGSKRRLDDPKDPEEKRMLEERRAYNRRCASKARQRNKERVVYLQTQVLDLTSQTQTLRNEQNILASRIEQLTEQNRILVLQQRMSGYGNAGGALPFGGGMMNNGFTAGAGGAAGIPGGLLPDMSGGLGNFGGGGRFASHAGYALSQAGGIGPDMQGYANLLGRVQEADRAAAEQRLRQSTMLLGNSMGTNNNDNSNDGDAEDDTAGNPYMNSSERIISSGSNRSDDNNNNNESQS